MKNLGALRRFSIPPSSFITQTSINLMKTSYLRLLLLDHLIFIALLKLFSIADEAPCTYQHPSIKGLQGASS